jgi:hypothetical protein
VRVRVLARAPGGGEGLVAVEHVKVNADFRPEITGYPGWLPPVVVSIAITNTDLISAVLMLSLPKRRR